MSIFSWIFGEKRAKIREFSDEEREDSIETRRHKRELKKKDFELENLKKEMQLEKLRGELAIVRAEMDEVLGNDKSGGADEMLLNLMQNIFNKQQQNNMPSNAGVLYGEMYSPIKAAQAQPTEQELLEIKNNMPKNYLKMAKKASPEELQAFILKAIPHANSDTINKAIGILKNTNK